MLPVMEEESGSCSVDARRFITIVGMLLVGDDTGLMLKMDYISRFPVRKITFFEVGNMLCLEFG